MGKDEQRQQGERKRVSEEEKTRQDEEKEDAMNKRVTMKTKEEKA